MRTDFFVSSLATPEGERLLILRPSEIPQRFFFASSEQERLRHVTLLTEGEFRSELSAMGLSQDEVDYQLERARGLHLAEQ